MSQLVAWLSIQPRPPRTGLAYVLVRVLVYIVALVLIVLVYGTRQRGLFVAPPVALIAAAGTWYLLGDTVLGSRRRLVSALGVGLLLAELTWAIDYWDVLPPVGGAALWLAFYVLSGLVEHGAAQALDQRIAREYGAVALIGAVVILAFARPWSS